MKFVDLALPNFLFSYQATGMNVYINGVVKGQGTENPSVVGSNTQTVITIGRPNPTATGNTYGTFLMDHLVIFYQEVNQEEIDTINPKVPTSNPTGNVLIFINIILLVPL